MSTEPETDVDNDPEPESDRSMDRELLVIQRALRLIKTLGADARAYVIARLKQP